MAEMIIPPVGVLPGKILKMPWLIPPMPNIMPSVDTLILVALFIAIYYYRTISFSVLPISAAQAVISSQSR